MVKQFGSISEFDFLCHRNGPLAGQPRGYAFVTYKNVDSAEKALKFLHGLDFLGRKLSVKWAHAQMELPIDSVVKQPFVSCLSLPSTTASETDAKEKKKSKKSSNKRLKLAELEAQIKSLESDESGVSFTPDIGGPSKPKMIIRKVIEKPKEPEKERQSYKRHHNNSRIYSKSRRK